MSYINIKTTQNVEITYEAASLLDRILAFFIDFSIMFGVYILYIIVYLIGFGGNNSSNAQFYILFGLGMVLTFYTLISETVGKGAGIGKRAMKIKVIKLDGKEPRLGDYLIRWLFRFIDIFLSVGTLATFFIISGKYNQRIGDLIANTTIIKTKFNKMLNLNALENIKKDIEVTFQQAKLLNEDFALVIKNSLDRYKEFPTDVNFEILETIKDKLLEEIDFGQFKAMKTIPFLQTILKDYVILTR